EGDLEDQASRILTKHGIDFESKKGKILLKMAFKQFHHAVQRSSESILWNRFKDEGRSSKTGIEGEKNPGDGEIRMKAFEGIEYEHRADSSLKDFLSVALKEEQNVIWRAINDEHDSWCEESESLGIVAAAAIVIVVSYFTLGSCSGLVAPLTSAGVQAGLSAGTAATMATGVAAGLSAGVSAVASQAALSIVNNGGDLGAVAKELTSSQSMKSLAVSMVSAGVCGELLKAIDIGTAISGDIGQQVLSRTQEAAIRAGVNTVLKSTIDGRNFGDVLTEEARSGAANVVGGALANKVGVEYKAKDSDINYVMHKIIHGVIGGISGLISGGTEEAFAAAIGATIGEIVGEGYEKAHRDGVYDPNHPSFNAKEREDMVKKGTMFSELSTAVFAGVLGQAPNAAARAAKTAVTENAFNPYNPTPPQYSQDQIGDVVEDVVKNSTTTSEEEAVAEISGALQEKLPSLGLNPEEAEIMAIECFGFARENSGVFSVDDMNKIALQTFLDLKGPSLGYQFFEAATDCINDDLDFHADLGEEWGSSLGTFFSDDEEIAQSFGAVGHKFGMAVGVIGMIPNPASLAKKAVVEGVKQAAKTQLKKEIKGKAKKKVAKETAKKAAKKPQTYEVKAGKGWKAKIKGRAQVTGGKKNPDGVHSWKSRKEAIKAAKRSDVVEVQMDLGVNRLLPKGSRIGPKGNRRPDVAYKTKDGKIHQIEVPSRTDNRGNLINRMKDTKSKLPEGIGGEVDVIERTFK
ncbi:MAG: DUF637 domain-containing protein, partial [Alphaproteobacteria bacterium]|nr:DUF637 domain-containing protein [Alphaproteobacteria bacterium]